MKSFLVKLGVLSIGFFILGNAEVWAEDWRGFGTSGINAGRWFYDAESLTYPSKDKDIVRVRTNVYVRINTRSKERTDRYVEGLKKRFKNLNQVMSLTEVHCKDKRTRILEMTSYSHDGTVLSSVHNPKKDWDSIVPGSRDENLYNAVCK
jgi:hypothetical protein